MTNNPPKTLTGKFYQLVEYYTTRLPVFLLLISTCSFVGSAAGFKIITPKSDIQQLQSTFNTLKIEHIQLELKVKNHEDFADGRFESLADSLEITNNLVRALVIGECIDRSASEAQLMQLPCNRLGVIKNSNGSSARR